MGGFLVLIVFWQLNAHHRTPLPRGLLGELEMGRNQSKWFSDFPMGNQEQTMDSLIPRGDEGRGVAAIRFGEVPSDLWSGAFRMGKPYRVKRDNPTVSGRRTRGSKTFQYPEEKRKIFYSLSSGERKGRSPNWTENFDTECWGNFNTRCRTSRPRVVREWFSVLIEGKLKNILLTKSAGKPGQSGWQPRRWK